MLLKQQYTLTIANPVHVKRFAGALCQRAKKDKIDAQLSAHYSEAIKPALSQLKPHNIEAMSDLVSCRNQYALNYFRCG